MGKEKGVRPDGRIGRCTFQPNGARRVDVAESGIVRARPLEKVGIIDGDHFLAFVKRMSYHRRRSSRLSNGMRFPAKPARSLPSSAGASDDTYDCPFCFHVLGSEIGVLE
jgi:hypothetical protein